MKKMILSVIGALFICTTFAQGVTVGYTGGSYSATPTVHFTVSWTAAGRGAQSGGKVYNSRVWVLIDYKDAATGDWERATIASLPAVTSGTPGFDGNNRRGFWFDGGSDDVSSEITVTLSNVPDKFSWCAFVSDYPPRIISSSNGHYTFAGTPPFTLTAADGTTQEVNGNTLAHAALTIIPASLTDRTNCPGVFCPYTGADLLVDATHICQQRTGGAKNWEAYMKDRRDDKIYRIVQTPDNRWWMAQNLDYRKDLSMNPNVATDNGVGWYWCYDNTEANCNKYAPLYRWETAMMVDGKYAGEDSNGQGTGSSAWNEGWVSNNYYTGATGATPQAHINNARGSGPVATVGGGRGICPAGWHVPTEREWSLLWTAVDPAGNYLTHAAFYPSPYGSPGAQGAFSILQTTTTGGSDHYGFTWLIAGIRLINPTFAYLNNISYPLFSSMWAGNGGATYHWRSVAATVHGPELSRNYNGDVRRGMGGSVRCVYN